MRLTKEMTEWVKLNQKMLKTLIQERKTDYMNSVVDEEDTQKKAVLSLFVKELRMLERLIENIVNQKENKKPEEDFTGV